MDITGIVKDPNVPESQQLDGLIYTWSCLDLVTSSDCKSLYGETAVFTSNNLNYKFAKRYFSPFSTLEVRLKAEKGAKKDSCKAVILVFELDIPLLIVEID